jgi:hypothetical protein
MCAAIRKSTKGRTQMAKKSGLTHKQSYNLMRKMVGRVQSIYASAFAYKLTYIEISERLNSNVLQSGEYKRLPAWAKSHISGYCEAKREDTEKYHLVWLNSLDGEFYTKEMVDNLTTLEIDRLYRDLKSKCDLSGPTFEEFRQNISRFMPSDYKSPWMRVNSEFSRHVWKDAHGNILSDKPYDRKFVGLDANGNKLYEAQSAYLKLNSLLREELIKAELDNYDTR